MRYFSPLWLDYSSGGLCRMIEERYELALDRIRLMQTEDTVKEPYRDYFKKMAEFVLMLDELRDELLDGRYQKFTLEELRTWNRRLYQDCLLYTSATIEIIDGIEAYMKKNGFESVKDMVGIIK